MKTFFILLLLSSYAVAAETTAIVPTPTTHIEAVAKWSEAQRHDFANRMERLSYYSLYYRSATIDKDKKVIKGKYATEAMECEVMVTHYNNIMSKFPMGILMDANIRPALNIGWCSLEQGIMESAAQGIISDGVHWSRG